MIIRYEFDSEKEDDMYRHKTFSNAEKYAFALTNLDLAIQRAKHSEKKWDIYDLRQEFANILLDSGINWDMDL
jgi:hypothetical protein